MIREKEIADPNSCLNKAEPGEPVFVLRANDELSPAIVREWAKRYRVSKGVGATFAQGGKHAEALRLADQMDAWRKVRT